MLSAGGLLLGRAPRVAARVPAGGVDCGQGQGGRPERGNVASASRLMIVRRGDTARPCDRLALARPAAQKDRPDATKR